MTDDTQNSPAFQEAISPTEHMQRAVFFSRLAHNITGDPGLKAELSALARKHSRLADGDQ